MENKTEELHVVTLVEAILRRPRMYTPNGSLAEVFCYVNGFYNGMATHFEDKRALEHVSQVWHGFLKWAARHLENCASDNWLDVYSALHRDYPDDTKAFEHCAALYREYRADLDLSSG